MGDQDDVRMVTMYCVGLSSDAQWCWQPTVPVWASSIKIPTYGENYFEWHSRLNAWPNDDTEQYRYKAFAKMECIKYTDRHTEIPE